MQEVFYEESAELQDTKRAKRRYVLMTVFMWVSFVLSALLLFLLLWSPAGQPAPAYILMGSIIVMFFVFGFVYRSKRDAYYLDFDYTFVTGSVRIAKIIHSKKRRALIKFEASEIIQLGKVGSDSYNKLEKSPDTKKLFATGNETPAEGKDFYYIFVNAPTRKEEKKGKPFKKKLVLLECTETLMVHVMKFAQRGVLEKDFK